MNADLNKISVQRYTWSNATRNVVVNPLRFFYPRNKEDISAIVKYAEQENLRVRAVGSGHSFSEAAKGKDCLLSMKRLSKAWKTPGTALYDSEKERLFVTAEAGVTLQKLNKFLDKEELALSNMGVIDVQTISGALQTGTHGTGIRRPAIPDMVRAVRLVGNDGKFYQIEPKEDAITDPLKFDPNNGVKLIQNDDHFYSTILSFGAMGIIYELILEVEPLFWMREKRYLKPWSELKKELENGDFMKKVRSTEFVAFRFNPYEVKGEHGCAVVEQEVVREDDIPRGFFALRRNILSNLFSNLEYLIEGTVRKSQILRKAKNIGKTINLGLWATKDMKYFDRSSKVLLQSGSAVIRYGISSEFAFKADAEIIIKVLEAIAAMAKENAENAQLFQTSHIPVRFVKQSKAYLSPAFDGEIVCIDVPLLYGTPGGIEILERYQHMMINEFGGIPHWGKHNKQLYIDNDFIQKKFKKAKEWMKVRKERDKKGTFINDFIEKLGLDEEIHQA